MMTPGTYYIGDLCYVLDDRWDEFCSITCKNNTVLDGEFNLADGTRFATYTTAWGDGQYYDEQGTAYGVDAGLIGCVLVDDITPEQRSQTQWGRVVTFDRPFTTFSSGGVISFGGISIDTDPDEQDSDTWEDEEAGV